MKSFLTGISAALLLGLPALALQNTMTGTPGTNSSQGGSMMGGNTMGGSMMGGNTMGGGMMGGQMLGGAAKTLAQVTVNQLPDGPLAWLAYDLSPIKAKTSLTSPAPGFLYAGSGPATVTVNGRNIMLKFGQAAFVGQGAKVSFDGGQGLLLSVLGKPGATAPAGLEQAKLAFSSPPLKDVPKAPVRLNFVRVDLPRGGQTGVHSHPGPEYIYVTQGDIQYQTGISDTEMLEAGDARALPANIAVQKRNPNGSTASFLSWFVVDPSKPFASEARFK